MLKRVNEFIDFINKNDPDANVIITADHGIEDVFALPWEIFTLIKMNEKCQQNIGDKINIPNGVRLLLTCTVGQKINLLEKKTYYVLFERGNYTIGGRFRLKRLDPDNYAESMKRMIEEIKIDRRVPAR